MIDRIPKLILGIVIGVVGTLISLFIYFRFTGYAPSVVPSSTPSRPTAYTTTLISPSVRPTSTPTPTPVKLDLGQVSWLPHPILIKPLSVFRDNKEALECVKNSSFQQTGTLTDGTKIINLIYTDNCGMGENQVLDRFLLSPSGQITYLADSSGSSKWSSSKQYFIDLPIAENNITGIIAPEVVDTKYGQLKQYTYYGDDIISFTQLKDPTLLTNTPYGNLYVNYSSANDPNQPSHDRRLSLRLQDDTVIRYEVTTDFLTDDRVAKITWNDGMVNLNQFDIGPRRQCGATLGDIFRSSSLSTSALIPAGKTQSGQTIYKISAKNHVLAKSMYDGHPYEGTDSQNTISIERFLELPSHFLWQDGFDDWHLYLSERFTVMAECGKPVIYLYPQVNTTVSVQVAADITQSDPVYPQNGWQVLAKPSGQLTYQGQSYPYLFWEGTGRGVYNAHPGEGFVVTQKDLIPTINKHLRLLGLNDTESADFMEFWQSKLPTTPYVRLTWLNTTDMNNLAPLHVSPRPDTAIRLFLEFEGLDQPTSLKPQSLSSPPRHGFTLVEWGGLLLK